ncbi:ABC transporter permease [Silvibacterium acidisoli]|uniref:ABC transporter permease n=1 Tax=Acidobacteriaceae bacterium ZG23-2 TaxID=2883246 RepID=UPI00406D0D28
MNWFRRIFRREEIATELAEEMRSHLEEKIEALEREGLSRTQAEQAARRTFGNATVIAERSRETWQWPRIESFWGDAKYALRQLHKSTAVSLIAIATIALGIGASVAIFTLSWNIILKTLPVPHPERLVSYELRDNSILHGLSGPFYKLLRERQTTSSDLMAWTDTITLRSHERFGVRAGSQTSLEDLEFLSSNSFDVLQLEPSLGRGFAAQDDNASILPAILSYDYWKNRFNSDTSVLGQQLVIGDHPAVIVGVMPRAFVGLTANLRPAVFLPLTAVNIFFDKDELTAPWPTHSGFYAMGRLKPGRTVAEAIAEAHAMEPTLRKDADPSRIFLAEYFPSLRLYVREGSSGLSWLKTTYEQPLLVLELLVALLLILCAVNTAIVMLARVSGRQQEYALRAALGASRQRIVSQVLLETLMLAVPGSIAGIFLGWAGVRALVAMLAFDGPPQPLDLRPNATILAVNAGITILVALGAAAVPAMRAAGTAPALDLKVAGRNLSKKQLGGWAIALQVAVSICMVSTAATLSDTLLHLQMSRTGFNFTNAAAASIDVTALKLTDAQSNQLFQRFFSSVKSQPGVVASAHVGPLPLSGHFMVTRAFSFDRQHNVHSQQTMTMAQVSAGYFEAAGTRILAGDPTPASAGQSCVLGRTQAESFFPGESAVGHQVYFSTFGKPDGTVVDPKKSCRVVAVAEDAKFVSLHRPAPRLMYQFVHLDSVAEFAPNDMTQIIVRAKSDDLALAALRAAAAATLPTGATIKPRSFIDLAHDDLSRERMLMLLSNSFAALALLLTSLGLYGLLMRSVNRRIYEIGIRLALGSPRSGIISTVVRRTLYYTAAGMLAGTAIAFVIGQTISHLLGINAGSALSGYFIAAGVMLAVIALSVVPPVRRATAVDPMRALRAE